jgi:hypothetical protein
MPSPEVAEWMASRKLDPWLEERLDALAGIIAWSNLAPWQGKDCQPMQPEDLVPDWDGSRAERKKRQAQAQWDAYIKSLREESAGGG